MKVCNNCHKQINYDFKFCPNCGSNSFSEVASGPMNLNQPQNYPVYQQPYNQPVNAKGHFGWAVLGFFIPIVGLILYLIWHNSRKGDAKCAGIGALVSAILTVICLPFMFLFTNSLFKVAAQRDCCIDAGGEWNDNRCIDSNSSTFDYYSYNKCIDDIGIYDD